MKKGIEVFSILLSFLVIEISPSCSKTKTNSNQINAGCIERMVLKPSSLPINAPPIINLDPITQEQIDTIKILFTNNNLPFNQYQFVGYYSYQYATDTVQTQVNVNPFLNGLPIFNDNEVFVFFNGVYSASNSYLNLTPEVPPNNDTTGHQNFANLRSAFLKHVSEATFTGPQRGAKPVAPLPSAYVDTCLSVTMGYIDQSYIPGNTFSLGHLIKVWLITPSGSNYPSVYLRDDNGQGWGVPVAIP